MKNRNKEIISFLKELSENNNKEWFDENRKLYSDLREYFIELTGILINRVSEFEPSVSFLEPRKSIFRINRDIRFSKNKSPYKNNFGAFIVPGGKKSGNAGYYLHLEPNQSFIGGGIHCPQSSVLSKVRWSIYENTDDFIDVIEEKQFKNTFVEIRGDKLKNPPRGFEKSFTHVDLLKYKSYTVMKNLNDEDLNSDDFIENVVSVFEKMHKFNSFINKALEE